MGYTQIIQRFELLKVNSDESDVIYLDWVDVGYLIYKYVTVEGQGQRPFTSQGTVRTPSRQSHLDPPEAVLTRRPYTTAGGK